MHPATEALQLEFDGDGYVLLIASLDTSEALDALGFVRAVTVAPDVRAECSPTGEVLSVWVRSRPYDDAAFSDNGERVSLTLCAFGRDLLAESDDSLSVYRDADTGAVVRVTVMRPCR